MSIAHVCGSSGTRLCYSKQNLLCKPTKSVWIIITVFDTLNVSGAVMLKKYKKTHVS